MSSDIFLLFVKEMKNLLDLFVTKSIDNYFTFNKLLHLITFK